MEDIIKETSRKRITVTSSFNEISTDQLESEISKSYSATNSGLDVPLDVPIMRGAP
jgi:hypothetical protein